MTSFSRVGEIAEQVRGVSYSKSDIFEVDGPDLVPLLRANNVTENGISFHEMLYVKSHHVGERQRLCVGDILVTASSGSIAVVGRAAQLTEEFKGTFGAFCKVIRPGTLVNPRYLGHFFKTPEYRKRMSSLAAGVNINNLKNEHIDDLLIPLPPLAEQSRIAAILDQVEVLRRKRREALERLNRLTRAVFIELFGVPGDALENGEPLRNLAELINGDRSSNYPSGDDLVESGIAFLNTKTISDGRIDIEFANFISEEKFRSLSRGKLKRNDLVITLRGSLGQCAEFDVEPETGFINAQMMIIRPGQGYDRNM